MIQACRDSGIDPRGLVLHSDNGAAMRGHAIITTLLLHPAPFRQLISRFVPRDALTDFSV
jgi:hypothetical protein